MKIGIYGGSFNPIHNGHINVANYAIDNLGLDKLYFVPSFKSPFKSKVKYVDAKLRVEMIELIKPDKTEVSLFEVNRKGISYTIDTVKYFKQQFPDDELFLIIGTDNLYKLHKWKEISAISSMVKIVVSRRVGPFSKVNIKKYNGILLDNEVWDISSTKTRRGIFDGIDNKVIDFIGKNQLYLLEMGARTLSAKRYKHCLAAADFAAKLAKANQMNVKQAWVAGLLHDITKEWPIEKHKEFLLSKGFDPEGTPELIWHQWTGAIWVDEYYRLQDSEVKEAIFNHSNADAMPTKELSKLTKVLYIADKICEGRRYEGIQEHRELVFKDLDLGYKTVAEEAKNFIINKYGQCVHYKLKKVGE